MLFLLLAYMNRLLRIRVVKESGRVTSHERHTTLKTKEASRKDADKASKSVLELQVDKEWHHKCLLFASQPRHPGGTKEAPRRHARTSRRHPQVSRNHPDAIHQRAGGSQGSEEHLKKNTIVH